MNKILAEKVKGKCKDMGLSEEYVNAITSCIGGSIADDSTDEQAIENVANQIANIAKSTQSEATRWVNKNNKKNDPAPPTPQEFKDEPEWFKKWRVSQEEKLAEIEKKNSDFLAERAKENRSSKVASAFTKHNIPASISKFMTVPDDIEESKIDEYVAGIAQSMITEQLPGASSGGRQIASKEETKAAAESFFKGLVKQNN